jgi:hydrogenase nickel incorporation protein HypA/HybF
VHELSLATAMMDQLEEILRQEGGQRICSVCVEIGALSGVEADPMAFAFPMAAEGTCAHGADLLIEERALELHCRACGQDSKPEDPFPICLACGSTDVDVIAGRDFLILRVEVE